MTLNRLRRANGSINMSYAFYSILTTLSTNLNTSFTSILSEFDNRIKATNSSVTQGALNNCHGGWYEWLIALEAWKYCFNNDTSYIPLKLPNVHSLNVSALYIPELTALIEDLKEKVKEAASVQFVTSNPDFVIIDVDKTGVDNPYTTELPEINPNSLSIIDNAYSDFVSKCSFESIIGYISVKTTLRPDRRLQIAHEGSLMKAIYVHLQTRQWILNPLGLKYYAISTNVNNADKNALKTIATHSITTVHDKPIAAVDDVFVVNSMNDANTAFSVILS